MVSQDCFLSQHSFPHPSSPRASAPEFVLTEAETRLGADPRKDGLAYSLPQPHANLCTGAVTSFILTGLLPLISCQVVRPHVGGGRHHPDTCWCTVNE